MGILARTLHVAAAPFRLAARAATYVVSTLSNPAGWLVQMFGGGPTSSGVNVNESTAMGVAAVFACVRVISEDLATLPLRFFERMDDSSRRPAHDFYLEELLAEEPNPEMNGGEFVEMLTGHLQLRGNAYAEIVWSEGGKVLELWPLHPDRVRVLRQRYVEPGQSQQLIYEITLPVGQVSPLGGQQDYLPPERVFHLRGLSSDGVLGLSPLDLHREAIGLSIALEKHAATFFGNGAQLGGVLETDKSLTDPAYARLQEYIKSRSGLDKAHRTAIFEEGLKWKAIGVENDHAQFLESRKYQRSEVAAIFRVPLHKIQDLDRSTNNNIEHQGIEYVVDAIRPNAVRWERAVRRRLMSKSERARFYARFNLDALARGDLASRFAAYAVGRQWGWLCPDDIREKEEMNDLPEGQGKVFLVPANMIDARELQQPRRILPPQSPPKPPPPDPSANEPEAPDDAPVRSAFTRVFAEAYGRGMRKESAAVMRAARKIDSQGLRAFDGWAAEFYAEHESDLRQALEPLALALAEARLGGPDAHLAKALAADLAQSAAKAHCRRALDQLNAAVRVSPSTPASAVAAAAEAWTQGGAWNVARGEVERMIERLSVPSESAA